MDKKIQKTIKLLVLPILIMFALSLVSAAVNDVAFVTPEADDYISGNQLLNVSIDSADGTVQNVSFYYMATGASTWTLIGMVPNTTDEQTHFNVSWLTTAFVDNDGYTLNATTTEADGTVVSTINITGVNIDNGVPTATLSSSTFHDVYNVRFTDAFTLGLNADSTIGIASCIAFFTDTVLGTVVSESISASGNACSSSTLTPEAVGLTRGQTYNTLIQATDGNTNSTNSTTRILKVTDSTQGTAGGTFVGVLPKQTIFISVQTGVSNIGTGFRNSVLNIINWFRNLFIRN